MAALLANVTILATGGTIAGTGASRMLATFFSSGTASIRR